MNFFWFFDFFLVLIVPGFIGALAYSIAARLKTSLRWCVALVFALLTFTTMITGLYCFKDVKTVTALLAEFECLSFTRNYILLSIWINIVYGVLFGLLRRAFFWLRRSSGC